MCGIAGIFQSGSELPAEREARASSVLRMASIIHHRGPDDGGLRVMADGRLALASRRLAIQDLSASGRMPLGNEAGDVWVALNGEIYNFQALRTELLGLGHRFRSGSDTEVIVHAWESWGPACLERLDGMFAIALYDEREGRLLLARDRCGEKPLYFARGLRGELVFASEIKAILEVWGSSRRVSAEALSQYLTYGYTMPPLTLFHGINKLAPGQAMLIERGGAARTWRYWTPAGDPALAAEVRGASPEHLAQELRKRLVDSVAARMVADVPVGASLSGGIDSSAVVAMMARLSGRPVETVTVGQSAAADLDESAFARRMAREVGAIFHRIEVSERDCLEALSDMAWHFDEPVSDPAAMNTYFVSRHLRLNGITVALVGEGADEAFLGYGNYLRFGRLSRIWPTPGKVPGPVRWAGERIGSAALQAVGATVHRDLLRRACAGETMFLGTETFFGDVEKPKVVGSALRGLERRYPSHRVAAIVQATAPEWMRGDPLSVMSFAEVQMRMAEKLLMRVDKMSMAHSIEVRAPFLDHRLIDFALSIPSSVRAGGGVTKQLLKAALAGIIPEEIIHRRKQGFATPVSIWMRGDLGRYLEERAGTSGVFRDGVLDRDGVVGLLQAYRDGGRQAKGRHIQLWNVLMLAEWYDRFGLEGVADDVRDPDENILRCAA